MKPFKFLKGSSRFQSLPQNNIIERFQYRRNYVGLNRGQIKWTDLPVCQVYYLNPTMSVDAVDEGGLPEISMNLLSQTITLTTSRIETFDRFMSINYDRYIIVLTIQDIEGNIYNEHNQEYIPRDQPLIIRCAILD